MDDIQKHQEDVQQQPASPKIDVSDLSIDEIDKLDAPALQAALRSVLRDEPLTATHQDHRSHTNDASA